MKLYSSNESYKLYQGNMLDMLEVIELNSIDSIITDPPYELNFMSKGWDNAGVSFQTDTWKKCYEVLKPGGYLLAFGGSRTFHRIACAIEDAGFEIRDTIMWLYGSGFPKSMDISKQIDKMPNRSRKNVIRIGEIIKENRNKNNLTQKQLGELIGVSRELINLYEIKGNNQQQIPTQEQWPKIKEVLKLNDEYDYIFIEAEREVIGIKKSGGASAWINGMNNKENEEQKYTGFSEWEITAPTTDLAKQWQGWGTALKPSFEPIIVARKPFKGSLVDNVIENGVGGINIDECRVKTTDVWHRKKAETNTAIGYQRKNKSMYAQKSEGEMNENGRFPANTILTYDETDFDEVCGGFPQSKGKGHFPKNNKNGVSIFNTNNLEQEEKYLNDSGSASRYFYNAKASKRDRDEGLPNKWLDNLELIVYDNIGDELWKDKITIKEENKVKHLEDMAASLQKVIEEYGIQTKKDIDLNTLLYGKKSLEKYLKENKYTTKTEINSTTVSQILNLLTLYTTKENTQDVKLETENGINHVEIVENTNQLEIIIKGNQELVPGANNVVLKMLLKINEKEGRNEHCTVKPTDLMQYLVRLITPDGGTILDPFNGSGSTGKAVMYENKERSKNYKYIGIELTEEYLPISKARIEYVCNLIEKEKKEDKQISIFDELEG